MKFQTPVKRVEGTVKVISKREKESAANWTAVAVKGKITVVVGGAFSRPTRLPACISTSGPYESRSRSCHLPLQLAGIAYRTAFSWITPKKKICKTSHQLFVCTNRPKISAALGICIQHLTIHLIKNF